MTKLEEPDVLDRAMMNAAKAKKKAPKKPMLFQYLRAKRLDNANREALIRKYNEYFRPALPITTNCPSTLKAIQIKLKKHLNIK